MKHADQSKPRSPRRREVLAGAAAGTAAMLIPPVASAASDAGAAQASIYPARAFAQTSEAAALQAMFGKTPAHSSEVRMSAPDIAENGAVVPVAVDANLPDVTTIAIMAIDNPFTMAAAYKIPAGTSTAISSRIKLAKTTKVVTVVESAGKLYSTSKQVKVTLGGCG
ncbi:thiosulfate oxidation carrier protein SoxY [Acidiphilium iwatense]|uniref:Thiosulfate oxidation carrier protein SoxY n=1 Tax=Acidiphilium iwatense TaxID=768198 RepID=A0ABS9DR50_9PROT|nr:thiosulfate oxidation carrier protein SoxY [Acidiphilium iwatense]MCF3945231.1 thiosulfate oxidation carrier protein SoxY [Acidiphilium iwatense]